MGGPDMGGLILYGACNGGPGIVRNVPNPAPRRWRCFTDRKNMPIILVFFTYWKSNCEEEKTKNVSYDKWDSNDARRYMYMI